jgi:hypothetical protein
VKVFYLLPLTHSAASNVVAHKLVVAGREEGSVEPQQRFLNTFMAHDMDVLQ